mmetsp:Transcript_6472/g.9203  ORF Transcript_6472/g.9203 Transcript_6472/m.9203 type:complete len:109 (+) Transcript_6472:277-603(+)
MSRSDIGWDQQTSTFSIPSSAATQDALQSSWHNQTQRVFARIRKARPSGRFMLLAIDASSDPIQTFLARHAGCSAPRVQVSHLAIRTARNPKGQETLNREETALRLSV